MKRLCFVVALAGCTSDRPPCVLDTNAGCPETLQCETVAGEENPLCVPPLVVVGTVFQSQASVPGVSGARVLLVDEQGIPVAPAASSDFTGRFELRVRAPRDADLRPMAAVRTLRVEASGFQIFPSAYRPAPSINLADATLSELGDRFGLASDATRVALVPAPTGGTGSVSGTLELPETVSAPTLVIAEPEEAGAGGGVSLVDSAGGFRVFGLLPGAYTVRGVALGRGYEPRNITLNTGEQGTTEIVAAAGTGVRVSGEATFAGGPTTVSLVVAETLNPEALTADVVPGSQQPLASSGSFSVDGVPPGRFVVLAGFGNDALVRAFGQVEVADSDVTAPPLAPPTALPLDSPGASGPQEVSLPPMISWQTVAGAARYHVEVTDPRGVVVWDRFIPVPGIQVAYDGPLAVGGFYRARVTAFDTGDGNVLATTDELAGVFFRPVE